MCGVFGVKLRRFWCGTEDFFVLKRGVFGVELRGVLKLGVSGVELRDTYMMNIQLFISYWNIILKIEVNFRGSPRNR